MWRYHNTWSFGVLSLDIHAKASSVEPSEAHADRQAWLWASSEAMSPGNSKFCLELPCVTSLPLLFPSPNPWPPSIEWHCFADFIWMLTELGNSRKPSLDSYKCHEGWGSSSYRVCVCLVEGLQLSLSCSPARHLFLNMSKDRKSSGRELPSSSYCPQVKLGHSCAVGLGENSLELSHYFLEWYFKLRCPLSFKTPERWDGNLSESPCGLSVLIATVILFQTPCM